MRRHVERSAAAGAILGFLQGLTEFLPISSSAHLIVMPWVLGWSPLGLRFDVLVHLGTLLSVLIYFRNELVEASPKRSR